MIAAVSLLLSAGCFFVIRRFLAKPRLWIFAWYPTWVILGIQANLDILVVEALVVVWCPFLLTLFLVIQGTGRRRENSRGQTDEPGRRHD